MAAMVKARRLAPALMDVFLDRYLRRIFAASDEASAAARQASARAACVPRVVRLRVTQRNEGLRVALLPFAKATRYKMP